MANNSITLHLTEASRRNLEEEFQQRNDHGEEFESLEELADHHLDQVEPPYIEKVLLDDINPVTDPAADRTQKLVVEPPEGVCGNLERWAQNRGTTPELMATAIVEHALNAPGADLISNIEA